MIKPLFPHPALLMAIQKARIMAIADLHIGWEMALAERGIHVPPQMPKLLQKLKMLICTYKPEKLLILGDIKHTVATAEMGEWHDIPDFFTELKKYIKEIDIIRGNHDGNLEPLLPEGINLLPATGIAMGSSGFFHGHRWPSPTLLQCETLIMGHVHPVVVFRDPAGFRITRQVWVKMKCDGIKLAQLLSQKYKVKIKNSSEETVQKHHGAKPKTLQLFIMPSFNEFLGGKPLNERRFVGKNEIERIVGPILRSDAISVEKAETYLLDGTFLGTLNQLTF